jgi:VWFA-related protein
MLRPSLVLSILALAARPAEEPDPAPREIPESPLVERVASRLAQIDVTVSGPPELVQGLTPEDFRVRVGLKRVASFTVDRFCGDAPGELPAGAARPASYVLYFDQSQLTLSGRNRALMLARELVPQLLRGGSRGMVVSNARRLAVLSEFTGDPGALLATLDRLENDLDQWDLFAEQERDRLERVVEILNQDANVERAIAMARICQREERWRTERSLRRLESVLGRLSEIEPPKAVIYFADTLRSNAGEHYLRFFGRPGPGSPVLAAMSADAASGSIPFDRVVDLAAAEGIRFYTILAQGLGAHLEPAGLSPTGIATTGVAPAPPRVRQRDAQNTLSSLAHETGGRAFLNGASAHTILKQLGADFSCLYLISLDPAGLTEDSAHRLAVHVTRPGVEVRSRGRIVLRSESSRLTSRLLGAFAAPGAADGEFAVGGELVPIGYRDRMYSALVQVRIPALALAGGTWDLGASLVSREKVRAETSGRVEVGGAGVPVVLEGEIRLPPGPFEFVAVAHEAATDLIASAQRRGSWPDPDHGPVTAGPIAVLQPEAGAFLRDGKTRSSGSVAFGDDRPVVTSQPTAFVGLVCRGRSRAEALRIERTLRGSSEVDFPPIDMDAAPAERCAQVRDLVPAQALGQGAYFYELRVLRGERVVGRAERSFVAVDPGS